MAIRRIHSKGDWRHDEAVATAVAITPGMIVERITGGYVRAHSTEGGDGAFIVAMEDALQGKTVSQAYAVSVPIMLGLPVQGSEMNCLLVAGESVVVGDDLVSNGLGMLIAEASVSSGVTVAKVFGKAAQVLDLSASGAVNTLCAVEVL
ncbi:MAG TPA: hypothetical protein VMW91_01500 [Desulfosporosinus sp.]|nr:hypothetical protein [Desulfosporosinus sp.]